MPEIYRAMREDKGKPAIGASATTLGVRVPTDIAPDAAGHIHPGTGGMSVSPSLADLPPHRIPRRLRHLVPDASGKDELRVWSVGNGPFVAGAVATGLKLRPDPRDPGHGFVEPDVVMALGDYQDALGRTQHHWSVDET